MNVQNVKFTLFDTANFYAEMAERQLQIGNHDQMMEYTYKHEALLAVIETLGWGKEYQNKFNGL